MFGLSFDAFIFSPFRFFASSPFPFFCHKKGNFTNTLAWHIVDEDITGHLVVDCTYELDPKGRMVACLEGHTLLPTRKMPKDPDWLARALQRAMPIELFDPDNRGLETTVSIDERKKK